MQIISNDKTARINLVQDLKDFKSQSLAIQAKKGEQLVSMMAGILKSFQCNGICYSGVIYRKQIFEKQNGLK